MNTTKQTWIQPEEMCRDYGQFRRKARVFHNVTGELVRCRADIPDTFFSIPATTKTEYGYITGRDDGELEFRPMKYQYVSPAEYRKQYKKDCR
jgi:hypothetical protein